VTVTGTAACAGTNGTDVTIPDTSVAVTSAITIAGCGGNGGATARVDLKIRHTYIGDLVVDLVSPTGLRFPLHDRNGAAMDNIDRSYTISLLGQPADGEWKIEARDVELSTTGRIDTWTLTLK
jgi:carboxypeptidase T